MSSTYEPHGATSNTDTSLGHASYSAGRIQGYLTAVDRGDAPITTLMQQQDANSRNAARQAKVRGEVSDAIEKYNQTAN
ncbi:hypothetical protein GGR53DRAFT_508966 [Hypoxylon sp. FL1150]|nr:hypothetical protein GGR53DRAFT_508966 [Hypoxylon sp. FL1150]